jgi:hypothetical protein
VSNFSDIITVTNSDVLPSYILCYLQYREVVFFFLIENVSSALFAEGPKKISDCTAPASYRQW